MKRELLAEGSDNLAHYQGGMIQCLPQGIKFKDFDVSLLPKVDKKKEWARITIQNAITAKVETWYIRQYHDLGQPVIDIQSADAYNDSNGKVYRLWPDNRCRASLKQVDATYTPQPIAPDFLAGVLPVIAETIADKIEQQEISAQPSGGTRTIRRGAATSSSNAPSRAVRSNRFIADAEFLPQPHPVAVEIPAADQTVPARIVAADENTQVNADALLQHLNSAPPQKIAQPALLVGIQNGQSTLTHNRNWLMQQYPNLNGPVETPEACERRIIDQMIQATGNGADPHQDYHPPLVAMNVLEQACAHVKAQSSSSQRGDPTFRILSHVDAHVAPGLAYFDNAVFVGAAQGNCLEAPNSRRVVWAADYCNDPTQGPALQQTTPDAAVSRLAFRKQGEMVEKWLNDYDPDRQYFHYRNGYLTPKLGSGLLGNALRLIQAHGKELLTNLQRVEVQGHKRLENGQYAADAMRTMTHMACYAINIGQFIDTSWDRIPTLAEKDLLDQCCYELLKVQYEAVAHAAVLQARATGRRVPLVLTPIGGGAFRNNPQNIAAAMSTVHDIVQGENVDVMLSIWSHPEINDWKANVTGFQDADILTTADLEDMSLNAPAAGPSASLSSPAASAVSSEQALSLSQASCTSSQTLQHSEQRLSPSLIPEQEQPAQSLSIAPELLPTPTPTSPSLSVSSSVSSSSSSSSLSRANPSISLSPTPVTTSA